jgi:hypothetical protein
MFYVCASARSHNGAAVAREAHIAKRCEGPKGRAVRKKKARRRTTRLPTKRMATACWDFHCSQKRPAANRAIARFLVVASGPQQNVSTAYPQMLVDGLGIDFEGHIHPKNDPKEPDQRVDCSGSGKQSPTTRNVSDNKLCCTFLDRHSIAADQYPKLDSLSHGGKTRRSSQAINALRAGFAPASPHFISPVE